MEEGDRRTSMKITHTSDEKRQGTGDSMARKNCYRVWTLVGVIILIGVLGYVLNILSVPVGIILWSTVIIFVLRTPVNRMEKRGINRVLATAIAYVVMFLVLLAIGTLLFSPVFGIGDQFRDLLESIPYYAQRVVDIYNDMYAQYSYIFQNEMVKSWLNDAAAALGAWATNAAKMSADGIVSLGSSVANSFLVVGFALVVAFWLLMELPAFGRECRRLIGDAHVEDAEMLYITFTRIMGGYIKATLIQCALIGVLCGIAFAVIGIPNAAALGGITGILNIIPVVGPWLGGLMAALIGVFINPWVALIALIATIAIQQFIYTFVSPKLMADSVNVHPALVIIALMAGSAIGMAMNGLVGMLVGMLASIPAVAAFKALFVYYFEKKTGRGVVAEDGVFFKGTPAVPGKHDPNPLRDGRFVVADSKEEAQEPMKGSREAAQPDPRTEEGGTDERPAESAAHEDGAAEADPCPDRASKAEESRD